MSELGLTTWEPGVYHDIPFDIYKKIPAINQSVLKHFRQSPAHARHYQLYGMEDTEDLRLGNMIHTALLEWERWCREFIVQPDFTIFDADGVTKKPCLNKDRSVSANPRNTTDYANRVSQWELKHLSKFKVCTAEEKAVCDGIAASVATHSHATKLLTCAGENELTIVWRDPLTKLLCKARIDRLATVSDEEESHRAVVDLKSCTDARKQWFSRDIDRFGYHLQAPYYGWGLAQLGKPVSAFYHVALEKSAPFGVGVHRIGQKSLDQGWREIRKYLTDYAECLERNQWPLYADVIEETDIPRYSMNDIGME